MKNMKYPLGKNILIIFLILLSGFLFRFVNINWDNNHHLHPDERFLTMVGNSMKIPSSFSEYLDQEKSLFNPRNVGHDFFVYGSFPLSTNKLIATILNNDDYNNFTLQGRVISAFLDLLVILVIFKTAQLLEKNKQLPKNTSYWASFLYAISVLPIQLSHFFTVDIFANLFVFGSLYFSLKFYYSKEKSKKKRLIGKQQLVNISLSAILLGLALASKLNTLLVAPLIVFFITLKSLQKKNSKQDFISLCLFGFIFSVTSYITLRLADPYLFAHKNLLNPIISPEFIANFKQLKTWDNKDVWFPPAVQWINTKPILFSTKNLAFFGIGLPYFSLLVFGGFSIFKKISSKLNMSHLKKNLTLIIILTWCLIFFLYQSTQFVKALRYFLYLYPYFAIIAGAGISYLSLYIHKKIKIKSYSKDRVNKFIYVGLICTLLIWPLMFISIYIKPHPRITASEWIHTSLESESIITYELWDDPLPLGILTTSNKNFKSISIPVFNPDSNEKMDEIWEQLNKADYYVLSSNRGWGSMPTVSEKYPYMTKFYDDLFSEKTRFTKIADFTSYPSLEYLGIPITLSDDWADETFTVYDHPRVMIYKNSTPGHY